MSLTRAVAAVLIGAALAAEAVAAELDVDLGSYVVHEGAGALVTGRAWAERRRPEDADPPLPGTMVMLVPRSPGLLWRLEEHRRTSRTSMTAYRAAAVSIREELVRYGRMLEAAGAAALVRVTTVDESGRFAFPEVPAGNWVVFGWHEVAVETRRVKIKRQDRQRYEPPQLVTGYQAVTVWVRPLTLPGDAGSPVDLTDRNGWFTGVIESTVPGAGAPAPGR